jgi:hypothetical protein
MLVGSAAAQAADPTPVWTGSSFGEKMNGVEVSNGVADLEDNMTWGKTITLRGESGEFTANINTIGTKPDIASGNKVVGGTWTLTVYKGGLFYGKMFGEFVGGIIEYQTDENGAILSEHIRAEMVIKGGEEAYKNIGGDQTYGVLDSDANLRTRGRHVYVGSVSLIF